MLIYRRRQTPDDLRSNQALELPCHLEEELQAYNRHLGEEREAYERERQMVDVMAFHSRHLRLVDGQIHRASATKTDGGDAGDRKLFTLSKDTPVAQLVADIQQMAQDSKSGEGVGIFSKDADKELRLEQVEIRGTALTLAKQGVAVLVSSLTQDATLETIGRTSFFFDVELCLTYDSTFSSLLTSRH